MRINLIIKDSELHPLARWQFQGGLHEDERRAFLFTNVVGANGEKYDMRVLVGAAAPCNPAIYAAGLGVAVEEIGKTRRAMANPIPPVVIGPGVTPRKLCKPGRDLGRERLGQFPVPVSRRASTPPRISQRLCVLPTFCESGSEHGHLPCRAEGE